MEGIRKNDAFPSVINRQLMDVAYTKLDLVTKYWFVCVAFG